MIIELLNGTRIDLNDHGIYVEDYNIPSLEISHMTVNVDGRDSPIILDTKFIGRTIPVSFVYKAFDYYDYNLIRDELNSIFVRKEPFFIIFKDEPYRRWLVKTANQFAPLREIEVIGTVEISFVCVNIYAESVATTQDLKEWDVNKWAWDGTIDWDEDLIYTFDTNTFTVKNRGNVEVDPREHELEITIKATSSDYLEITNHTTDDVFRFNGSLTVADTLVIKGISYYKNGVSVLKNTNKKLITLAPGSNTINVEGGTVSSIAFNFRFLYK